MDDFSTDQGLKKVRSGTARALVEHREELLREWERRVRENVSQAVHLEEPVLINTLPAFLDNLAEAISPEHPREDATEDNTAAQEHGEERARLTDYGPDQIIVEYKFLREVVMETLDEHSNITDKERLKIHSSFDNAVRRAVLAFTMIQNRLREHFVATLTHDLRNPLGASRMALEIILSSLTEVEDDNLREDLTKLVKRALNNNKRADRLIQNLLDASVLHAGRGVDLNLADCDLLTITHEVIADLQPRDQSRFRVKGETARGCWDPDALRRVIENLVSNALKYGTPGRPIEIKVTVAHGRVTFTIHNEGPEIPLDEISTLFEVFNRARSAKQGSKPGWGIGLALVRAVSEAHGGSIGVDSEKERGTTFTVDLPLDSKPFVNGKTGPGASD